MQETEAKVVAARSGSNGFQLAKRGQPENMQTLKEENEILIGHLEQMKVDMEAMVGKVREELMPGSFGQTDPLLQDALVAKSGRINELE
jgi:hypothetical protein